MLRATTSSSRTGVAALVPSPRRLNSALQASERVLRPPPQQNSRPQRQRQQRPPGKYTVLIRTWERMRSPGECLAIVDYLAKTFGPVDEFKAMKTFNNSVLVRFREAASASRAAAHTESISIPFSIKTHAGGIGLEDCQQYLPTQDIESSSSSESKEKTERVEAADQQEPADSVNPPEDTHGANDIIIRIAPSSDLNEPFADYRQYPWQIRPFSNEAQNSFLRWGGFAAGSKLNAPKMQSLVQALSSSSPGSPTDTKADIAPRKPSNNIENKPSKSHAQDWEPLSVPVEHDISSELKPSPSESVKSSEEPVIPQPTAQLEPEHAKSTKDETPSTTVSPSRPAFEPIVETEESLKLGKTQVNAAELLLQSLQKTKASRPEPSQSKASKSQKARAAQEPFLEPAKNSESSPSQQTQPLELSAEAPKPADQPVEPSKLEKKKLFGGWF